MSWQYGRWETLVIVMLVFSVSSQVLFLTGRVIAQTGIQEAETTSLKAVPQRELLLMMEIPIVITAAKREQPIIEAPSTISVITAEQIREAGVTNLADTLRMIPGIDVLSLSISDQNVSARGLNSRSLSGPGSDRMLVLVDGYSVYLDFFGFTFWSAIPIVAEDIKQIEIIRGPSSALYGANAFAGVINIITKSPKNLEGTRISIDGGELGTYMASVTHADSMGNLGYKLSFGWDRANHWRDVNQIGKRDIKGNMQVEYELNPTAKATLSAAYNGIIGEITAGTNLNPFKFKEDGIASRLKFNYVQDNLKFQTFWTRIYSDVRQPNSSANYILTDTYDIELQNSIRLGSRNIVTAGGSYRLNTINSDLIDEFHRQNLFAAYLQDEFEPVEKLAITVGARYDNHPLTENPLTPRASITYSPTQSHIFRVSASKAFRNPTFIESYLLVSSKQTLTELNPQLPEIPFTLESRGNPDLNPEEITTYGVSYQTTLKNRISSRFNLFFNQLDELIELGPIETFPADYFFEGFPGDLIPSTVSYYNRGRAKAIGGEVDVTFYATKWLKGFANYSYQRFTDTLTNQRIKSAPEHKLNGGVRLKFGNGIRANVVAHYVSQTEWDRVKLDAYTLVNARIAYAMMEEHAEISVSAFNLLNNKHREHPLGDEIGRRITAGLTYRF